jgi:hypothetical protein
MNSFSLNRLSLIEEINDSTPICVIKEIVNCSGQTVDIDDIRDGRGDVLEFINSYKEEIEIKDDYSEEELIKIALFVSQNSETEWEERNLIKAFNHLVSYNYNIPEDFDAGLKDNNNPLVYDCTMLYGFCIENDIKTTSTYTLKDLATCVGLFYVKKGPLLDKLRSNASRMDKQGLINMLMDMKGCRMEEFIMTDTARKEMMRTQRSLNPLVKSLTTNVEAIVYSARDFGLDLTSSLYPSFELQRLAGSKEGYVPSSEDQRFLENYTLNPKFYDMTKFWKPNIEFLYSDKMLAQLLNNECINHADRSDPKEFLNDLAKRKNVYPGIIPNSKTTETFVYRTPLSEIENKNHIISYGALSDNSIISLTVNEIIEFLKTHKELRDFENNVEYMTDRNIKKLVYLCRSYPMDPLFTKLAETIEDTKIIGSIMDAKIKEFNGYIKTCSKDIFYSIEKIFADLFELSMYMRGWEKGKAYPLKTTQCQNYGARFDVIEDLTAKKMVDIMENINNLSDTAKILIKSLPLIKLTCDKLYIRSINEDEGITFFERLLILTNQTGIETPHSCLRYSSTDLAATSQYYNIMLTGVNFVDITELEPII